MRVKSYSLQVNNTFLTHSSYKVALSPFLLSLSLAWYDQATLSHLILLFYE
jgi:hypothetical protein